MSRDPQRQPDYLGHILQAIERIQRYTDDMDELGFVQNEMAQDAVIRNFEVIGEHSAVTTMRRGQGVRSSACRTCWCRDARSFSTVFQTISRSTLK